MPKKRATRSRSPQPDLPYVRVVDGTDTFRLSEQDPADTRGLDKAEAKRRLKDLEAEYSELEDLLAFSAEHALLVIIQGRDASGKDGGVRSVLSSSNVQTFRVSSFKVPTKEELAHDFLWRIHSRAPKKGELALFNRSHYEDVLATRIHNLVPPRVWKARYEHINAFERLLADSGTIVVKFFLHVSKDEQEKRLLAREQDPHKFWKLEPADWKERALWNKATGAYQDALNVCSSPALPWYIVSADKKWFRNLALLDTIVKRLRPYRQTWLDKLEEIGRLRKAELRHLRPSRATAK